MNENNTSSQDQVFPMHLVCEDVENGSVAIQAKEPHQQQAHNQRESSASLHDTVSQLLVSLRAKRAYFSSVFSLLKAELALSRDAVASSAYWLLVAVVMSVVVFVIFNLTIVAGLAEMGISPFASLIVLCAINLGACAFALFKFRNNLRFISLAKTCSAMRHNEPQGN